MVKPQYLTVLLKARIRPKSRSFSQKSACSTHCDLALTCFVNLCGNAYGLSPPATSSMRQIAAVRFELNLHNTPKFALFEPRNTIEGIENTEFVGVSPGSTVQHKWGCGPANQAGQPLSPFKIASVSNLVLGLNGSVSLRRSTEGRFQKLYLLKQSRYYKDAIIRCSALQLYSFSAIYALCGGLCRVLSRRSMSFLIETMLFN